MVQCTNCGADNKKDSKFCIQCGSSLQSNEFTVDREVCFGEKSVPNVANFFILIFGLLLISSGVNQLLEFYKIRFTLWPWVLIVIGLAVIYWVLSRFRQTSN